MLQGRYQHIGMLFPQLEMVKTVWVYPLCKQMFVLPLLLGETGIFGGPCKSDSIDLCLVDYEVACNHAKYSML